MHLSPNNCCQITPTKQMTLKPLKINLVLENNGCITGLIEIYKHISKRFKPSTFLFCTANRSRTK